MLLSSYAKFLIELTSKKGLLFSFVLGAFVALALPPVYIIPLAFIGFSSHFLMLLNAKKAKTAFWLGWWFGFGYFVAGLYWISFALLVDFKQFGWLMPFAIFGIPSILAFYIAFVALVVFKIKFGKLSSLLIYACLWTIFEILRAKLFTGFPWNLIGYSWGFSDNIIQIASVGGIWILSFVSVLIFPSLALINKHNYIKIFLFILAVIVGLLGFGYNRLNNANNEYVKNIKVRVVQGNVKQSEKFSYESRVKILDKYKLLSTQNRSDDITHLIWPETAIPFHVENKSGALEYIKDAIPKNGSLITGALRAKLDVQGNYQKLWNSIFVIDNQGQIESFYDKNHLVPFGEYIPFRSIIPFKKITEGTLDFSKGIGTQTLKTESFINFSPLVCYEVIFPNKVADLASDPKLMINVTNDAWYGNTSGPYQHMMMAKFRATEQGLPLIRAANNGISAIFDSYGRVTSSTKLGETTFIDGNIAVSINDRTIFSGLGLYIVLSVVAVFAVIAILLRKY